MQPVSLNSIEQLEALQENSTGKELMKAAKLLLLRKLRMLEDKVSGQTARIQERSELIDFLSKYQQILNSQTAVDPKTQKLDLSKHESIDDFFKKADALKALAEEKRKRAADLPESKEKTLLLQQANEIDDTVNATALHLTKKIFTKEERAQLLDNVRLQTDLLKTQQSYEAHEVQRFIGERNEMIPVVRDIMSKMYETIKKTYSSAAAR